MEILLGVFAALTALFYAFWRGEKGKAKTAEAENVVLQGKQDDAVLANDQAHIDKEIAAKKAEAPELSPEEVKDYWNKK